MSSTITNATETVGPLLKLPPELRLVIYEQMFLPDEVCLAIIGGDLHKLRSDKRSAGGYAAILATCRVIYVECKPVLYNNTEFRILVHDCKAGTSLRWERLLKKESLRPRTSINNVRKLILEVRVNISAESRLATWTERFKHNLRSAASVRSLHITLTARKGRATRSKSNRSHITRDRRDCSVQWHRHS